MPSGQGVGQARDGRRNRYTVNSDSLFRHPAQEGHRVGPFLALFATSGDADTSEPSVDPGTKPLNADR